MRITIDSRANTLHFAIRAMQPVDRQTNVPALIDVGEGGRLIGVEVDLATGPLYIPLEEQTDRHTRSATIRVDVETDAAGNLATLIVPRRGEGYEITYPSGNR
jgi:hypothetical protein